MFIAGNRRQTQGQGTVSEEILEINEASEQHVTVHQEDS